MNSRDDDRQVTKEDISASQSLMSSAGRILSRCLKTYPSDSIYCDGLYKDFDRQRRILESQEQQYLAPLRSSIDSKKEQFNKVFDPIFENPRAIVEKLSEESQLFKNEIIEDTNQVMKAKREFAEFRNNELKQTVHSDPNYSSTGFSIDWSRRFASKEINTMLKMDLQESDESLKSIDKRILDNMSAAYVSTPEMFNDQLRQLENAKLSSSKANLFSQTVRPVIDLVKQTLGVKHVFKR